jgi:hypothetical protein
MYEREIFGHFSWSVFKNKWGVGPNAYRLTMSFSLLRSAANIVAALALVGDGGGLVGERGWDGGYSWSPGGRAPRAGRQMLLWARGRGRAWARAFRM